MFNQPEKKEEEIAPPSAKPNWDIDWGEVLSQAEAIKESVTSEDYSEGNDDYHYLGEAVMMAIYGNSFFDWWNKQVK
jgi:hypothetical protein